MEEEKLSNSMKEQLPYFYLPMYSDLRKYGQMGITTHEGIYHAIQDTKGLYETFGYGKKIADAGYMPDEFIWEHYIRSGAPKCADCIQNLIITYLSKYSGRFMNEYSEALGRLKGKCVLDKIDTSEACVGCICHPVHIYE